MPSLHPQPQRDQDSAPTGLCPEPFRPDSMWRDTEARDSAAYTQTCTQVADSEPRCPVTHSPTFYPIAAPCPALQEDRTQHRLPGGVYPMLNESRKGTE